MGTSTKEAKIWMLVLGLVAATGAIVLVRFDAYHGFGTGRWWQWLALVVGFVAAETAVVRVNLRSQTTAFTFIEIPLFLGAVFINPAVVWSAMAVGVAIAVFVIQRGPLVKSAFNIAQLTFQGAVGLWVFHLVASNAESLGPQCWIAASLAAIVSSALAAGALFVVLLMVDDRPDLHGMYRALSISALIAVANVSLALVGASLIEYNPLSLLLLVLPMLVVYYAYRAYVAEQSQRERVQAMHELALEVRSIRDHTNVAPVLQLVAEHLGARRAELVLFPSPTGTQAVRFRVTESDHEVREVGVGELVETVGVAHDLVKPATSDAAETAEGAIPASVAGAIRGEERPLGVLTVSDRLRPGSSFTDEDLALFSTIIEQLGLTFERHELNVAVSELEQRERELEHVAHHDPLTGLANRALLSMELDAALAEDRPTSLLYVDLDDFKHVNDHYGHDAGDEVLRQLAARFKTAVGVDDCVARLGGDEFAVLLDSSVNDVQVAQAILDAAAAPIDLRDGTVQVNASVGVARALRGTDATTLIKRADAAMYNAKDNGKGSLALAGSPGGSNGMGRTA